MIYYPLPSWNSEEFLYIFNLHRLRQPVLPGIKGAHEVVVGIVVKTRSGDYHNSL